MTTLPLGYMAWKRDVAQEPEILVRNRYFEKNPTNQIEQSSLLGRPGLKRWISIGEGPIRGIYSSPGSFSDALFAVSGPALYRVDTTNAATYIGTGLYGTSLRGNVSMAATARIGSTPEFLYLADGTILWLYQENSYATGTLTATGAIANGDKIKIDAYYYQWTSGSVNAGAPAGTLANPWLVALGLSNADALSNMAFALTLTGGTAGTTYSTGTIINPNVGFKSYTSTALTVQAIPVGVLGNALPTTVVVGANIAWSGATLSGGGVPSLTQVQVPDALGVISIGFIAGYIIVIVTQGQGYNGRWFWIEPGETIIRPLNFNTAERSPDPLYAVRVVGDQFWLLGQATTEVWYPNGGTDPNTPFSRTQGQLFDRGSWQGTDVQVKENLFLVDQDGAVFNLNGGLNRISMPGIEERIRKAMQAQQAGVM